PGQPPVPWSAPQGAPFAGQPGAPAPASGSGPGGGQPSPPGGQPGQQPRCYRHTDREAFVSCQRCGRPICPDCMRPASVGFHCPEEGGAPRRPARTALGGRAENASSGLVTKILIALCLVAFVLQGLPGLSGGSRVNSFTEDFGMSVFYIVANHEYYRLVSPAFLHGSIFHILINMYALYVLGMQLEATLGRLRYLALFLGCAVAGNTLSFLMHRDEAGYLSVGASTAIFGFAAAYYVVARRLRIDARPILIVIGINLVLTFTISGIDMWGHIGGLAAGLLLGLVYAYVPRRLAALQALGTVALVGVCVLVAVLGTPSLAELLSNTRG
ncbi:rhomboid family intramembrane serine protease, partial [Frankia nepalensis]|uniref:rhomboid family intramembrane serine protease n=1 Tax=Frankia nepalensis TaxID=1836974 RepID=UPI001EE3A36A